MESLWEFLLELAITGSGLIVCLVIVGVILIWPRLKFLWFFVAWPRTKFADGRIKKILGDLRDLRSHWVAYHQELLRDSFYREYFGGDKKRLKAAADDVLATVKDLDWLIGRRTLVARHYGHKI